MPFCYEANKMLNNTPLKVVPFELNRKVGNKILAVKAPAGIDPMYFEVAEYAVSALYQAFPFHKGFGEKHWRHKAEDYFKATVHLWGLEFAANGLCSKWSATEALKLIVKKNIEPTLGNFIAAYWKKEELLKTANHLQYIKFLEARLSYAYTIDRFNNLQNSA